MERWRALKRWQQWTAGGVVVLVLVIIIAALAGGGSDNNASDSAVATSTAATTTAGMWTPPATTPSDAAIARVAELVAVGKISGWKRLAPADKLAAAKRFLDVEGGASGVTPAVLVTRVDTRIAKTHPSEAQPLRALLASVAGSPPVQTVATPAPAPVPSSPSLASVIEASINDHLGSGDTDYGKPRAARAECIAGVCDASYNADTPVFDPEGELIDAQRPIFKDAFADHRLRSLMITTRGPVTSVGGKTSVEGVMSITCDRAANRQIDWDNVDAHGVKVLCDYNALVKF